MIMFAIEELGKQLAIKIIAITAVITIVLGFGTYKYIQFKEEEVKEKYVEELSAQKKSYDSQIEQINKVNAESLEKQKQIILQYQNDINLIQKEYDQKIQELDELKVAKIKEMSKKVNQDPEGALKDLAHKFGFEVVPVEE